MIHLGILSLDHPHATGNHLPALKYMKNRVRVAGIYHTDKASAQTWLDETGATYYSTREALLADSEISVVLVTSKNANHAQDCIAAAKAGKDILCDKPIAINVEECLQIIKAVRENNVRFLTTFPVRFNSAVQRTKQCIDEGKLGRITAIMATNHGSMYEPGVPDWVLNPAINGGGCLIDHTVHVADIIRWFTGDEFAQVKVELQKSALREYLPAEDIAVLHGTTEGGAIFQIDASWSRREDAPMWGDVTFRVVGTKGSVTLDLYNNQRMEVYADGKFDSYYPNLIVYEHGKIFEDYRAHVEDGAPLVGANDIDGLRTLELVSAGYKSAQQARTMPLVRNL